MIASSRPENPAQRLHGPDFYIQEYPTISPETHDRAAAEAYAEHTAEHLYTPLMNIIKDTPNTHTIVPAASIILTGILVSNSAGLITAARRDKADRPFVYVDAKKVAPYRANYYRTHTIANGRIVIKAKPDPIEKAEIAERDDSKLQIHQWEFDFANEGDQFINNFPILAIAQAIETRAERRATEHDSTLRKLCNDFSYYTFVMAKDDVKRRQLAQAPPAATDDSERTTE